MTARSEENLEVANDNSPKSKKFVFVVSAWIILLVISTVGILYLSKISHKQGEIQSDWPSNSKMVLSKSSPTLVVFMESTSDYSNANLCELEVIMKVCKRELEAYAVLVEMTDTDKEKDNTGFLTAAKKIPGLHVIIDSDGQLCQEFQADPDGSTYLYDKTGRMLFHKEVTGEPVNSTAFHNTSVKNYSIGANNSKDKTIEQILNHLNLS